MKVYPLGSMLSWIWNMKPEFHWIIPAWITQILIPGGGVGWGSSTILALYLFLFVIFGFPEAYSPPGWSGEARGLHLLFQPQLTLSIILKPSVPNGMCFFLIKLRVLIAFFHKVLIFYHWVKYTFLLFCLKDDSSSFLIFSLKINSSTL